MKAYAVTGVNADYIVLVVAKSPSQAKTIAMSSWQFHDWPYIELRAIRKKEADTHVPLDKAQEIEWDPKKYELFRNVLGWHELDEADCRCCGLTAFGRDEYEVCSECGQCKECGCEDDCKGDES